MQVQVSVFLANNMWQDKETIFKTSALKQFDRNSITVLYAVGCKNTVEGDNIAKAELIHNKEMTSNKDLYKKFRNNNWRRTKAVKKSRRINAISKW